MTVAFVLSGGASLGSIQVGMLTALRETGVVPDFLAGTSAGAVDAAGLAGHPDDDPMEGLGGVWRSLRRRAVFPVDPLRSLLGVTGRRNHLVDPGPLRRLLGAHLTFERIEDAPVPLTSSRRRSSAAHRSSSPPGPPWMPSRRAPPYRPSSHPSSWMVERRSMAA